MIQEVNTYFLSVGIYENGPYVCEQKLTLHIRVKNIFSIIYSLYIYAPMIEKTAGDNVHKNCYVPNLKLFHCPVCDGR